ncbi:hypothetical protein HPP92_029146 [Vanilla planifolia]|uniref:Uncharacterized protein n=1 Tax=Vanilla planifolia TaxID=51239 RepID=A0A835U1D6_VANPL|nr:hypothetical protein HPP92_029146 [Vanilla planifolia]KAG0445839.1 hypothetical protein HPP92_029135 [Vanilla planifolia]
MTEIDWDQLKDPDDIPSSIPTPSTGCFYMVTRNHLLIPPQAIDGFGERPETRLKNLLYDKEKDFSAKEGPKWERASRLLCKSPVFNGSVLTLGLLPRISELKENRLQPLR